MGKILVMMIGELDYTDILVVDWSNEATVPLPMITIGLFFLFVLTVSVVLVNLLVGTAKLRLSRRATLIETLCTDDILKWQSGYGSGVNKWGRVVMTGDPTGVQTMKKKNRNGNTFGIRQEQFVCSFLFFFLSLSTILLVTSFGHVPVTPPFYCIA